MLVTVIIPNYNHAKFLAARIESILHQTYQNFELIILDDFSIDNSLEIIEDYLKKIPQITHFIKNTSNSGSTFKQWEMGLKMAKGELIWIAESDDFAHVKFLEVGVEKFERYNIGLFLCNSWKIDSTDKVLGLELTHPKFQTDFIASGKNFIENFMILDNSVYNASSVLFRNPYLINGTIDLRTNFKLCADHLFWIVILNSSNIYYSAELKNYFRKSDTGVTNLVGKTKSLNERIEISKFLYSMDPISISLKERNLNLIYLAISSKISVKQKFIMLSEIKLMFKSSLSFIYFVFRSCTIYFINRLFLP
jgi:glycosyltransferase involved in cell wall biosynthesis